MRFLRCHGQLAAWVAALVLALGCGRRAAPPVAPAQPAARQEARKVDPQWVTVYDPKLAWNGYTLTLHDARIPVLLDMNGRPVHGWREARVKSRVRLLPDGSILAIGLGQQVVEYDWEGRQTWQFRTPGAIPHHDILRLANGNTLVLTLPDGGVDTLLEVTRAGQVVWTWKATALGPLFPARPTHPHDVTHINSLQELPENPWFAAGDRRFRPGNLLISARNINVIFIVERPTGKVVWSYTEGLDRQHEALMNGPGLASPGMIRIFNNRLQSFRSDHQSEILEIDPHIDPKNGSAVWRYRSPGFFSPTIGTQQTLPNGNVLITSTRGGRVFEITRTGEIAWEWAPPYEPVRAVRVSPDFCPQLAKLAAPALKAVVPPSGYRYVDGDSYRFARQGSRMKAVIEGEKRTVLEQEDDCRDLMLPAAAKVQVSYGVDRDRLRAVGRPGRPPRFTLRLRPARGKDVELLRDTVGLDGPGWREKTIPLDAYGPQPVRLCVEIDGGASGPDSKRERFAYWEQPLITSAQDVIRAGEDDGDTGDLTPEELEVRRKHLKALGYIG